MSENRKRPNNKASINFGWNTVKALGELKLLTRASYLMLVLVPIIAALWPSIRAFLNSYTRTLQGSIALLNTTSAELKEINDWLISSSAESADSISGRSTEIIGHIEKTLPELSKNLTESVLENPHLPTVWVWAFLAALMVFLGHLLYQFYAPDLIKNQKVSSYTKEKMDDYEKHPTNLKLGKYFSIAIKKDIRFFSILFPEKSKVNKPEPDIGESMLKNQLQIVEIASGILYTDLNKSKGVAARIAGLFYLVSILILLNITQSQVKSVLIAAGWL